MHSVVEVTPHLHIGSWADLVSWLLVVQPPKGLKSIQLRRFDAGCNKQAGHCKEVGPGYLR